jgi:hypothetical protein
VTENITAKMAGLTATTVTAGASVMMPIHLGIAATARVLPGTLLVMETARARIIGVRRETVSKICNAFGEKQRISS